MRGNLAGSPRCCDAAQLRGFTVEEVEEEAGKESDIRKLRCLEETTKATMRTCACV